MRKLSWASVKDSIDRDGEAWGLVGVVIERGGPGEDPIVVAAETQVVAARLTNGWGALEPFQNNTASVALDRPLSFILRYRRKRTERDFRQRGIERRARRRALKEARKEPVRHTHRQDGVRFLKRRVMTYGE